MEGRLEAARVATLFRFARQVYVGGVAAGGMLLLVLWESVALPVLLGWFGALIAALVARLAVQHRFTRDPRAADAGAWERRFAIATLAIGGVWGAASLLFFPAPPVLQAAVVVLVAGVAMTGAGFYAASPRVVQAIVLLPMASLAFALAHQPTFTHRVLAIAMVVLAFLILRVAHEMRGSVVDALRARLEQEALLDTLPVGVAFVRDRVVARCNHRLEQILGYEAGELTGRSTQAWFRSEERWREAAKETYRRLAAGGIMEGDARLRRKDGSSVWCRVIARASDPAAPEASAIFTFLDVDERVAAEKALRESEEKLRLAVEAADLAYWEWDRASGVIRSNGEARAWGEYRDRVHPEDRQRYLEAVESAWKNDTPYSAEYRVVTQDGRVNWVAVRGKALRDGAGRVDRMIGVVQDVTDRRQQDDMVRFLAYHDALTGLPNRRLLEDRLKQALLVAQRREARAAVLLIDLDDFKQVNDTAGHRAGDAVLREVALRLGGCMRKSDTLARQGGDEFVLVMTDFAAESDCAVVAEKIHRALGAPIALDGREFTLGASIGIAVFPGDAADSDGLLRNADAAMYRAKQLGRNHYRFYSG